MIRQRFSTGLHGLDRLIGPIGPHRLMVISGISQSGMTTTLLTIARHAAIDQGVPTVLIDLETHGGITAMRLLAGEAGIDHRRINHDLEGLEAAAVDTARALLAASPLEVLGPGPKSVTDVRYAVLRSRVQPRLVLIDGARLLAPDIDDQREALDRLAVELKVLAGQLNVAVVATHPLRHTFESEWNPGLEHVDTAQGLFNHADHFVMLHRPEMYADR